MPSSRRRSSSLCANLPKSRCAYLRTHRRAVRVRGDGRGEAGCDTPIGRHHRSPSARSLCARECTADRTSGCDGATRQQRHRRRRRDEDDDSARTSASPRLDIIVPVALPLKECHVRARGHVDDRIRDRVEAHALAHAAGRLLGTESRVARLSGRWKRRNWLIKRRSTLQRRS